MDLPSRMHQVMQRSRSGVYVRNMSDISLFTLCTMLKGYDKVKSLKTNTTKVNFWQTKSSQTDIFVG